MTVACVAASTATSATAHSTTTMSLPDFLLPPPGYSLSAAAPLYSAEPGPSEQRLAITSRKSSRTQAGTLRRSHSGIVIALRDQDDSAEAPTYGRGGYIAGDVELASTQSVLSVSATVSHRIATHRALMLTMVLSDRRPTRPNHCRAIRIRSALPLHLANSVEVGWRGVYVPVSTAVRAGAPRGLS